MIPVRGVSGQQVAILGLGRSGLTAARAIRAGGGEPVCWDDNPAARASAENEGFACRKLTRAGGFDGVVRLVAAGHPASLPYTEPGAVAAALEWAYRWTMM